MPAYCIAILKFLAFHANCICIKENVLCLPLNNLVMPVNSLETKSSCQAWALKTSSKPNSNCYQLSTAHLNNIFLFSKLLFLLVFVAIYAINAHVEQIFCVFIAAKKKLLSEHFLAFLLAKIIIIILMTSK